MTSGNCGRVKMRYAKMALRILMVIIGWTLIGAISEIPQNPVSYFGNSYQYVRAENVGQQLTRTRTNVEMWFKTARSDCFLLLANGTRSTCVLRLKAGRLEVEFRIDGSEKIQFLSPLSLGHFHDTQWHKVQVQRSADEFSLSIDEKNLTFRTQQIASDAPFALDDGLYLGGFGSIEKYSPRTSFRGCLADVHFNGQNLHTVDGIVSERVDRSCPRIFDAESADLPFQLPPNSYLNFEMHAETNDALNLHFDLKTASKNAPLFTNPSDWAVDAKSAIQIDIMDGSFLIVWIDQRSEKMHRSRIRLNDSRWHSVDIRFNPDKSELIVDNITELMIADTKSTPALGRAIKFGSRNNDAGIAQFQGCLHNIVLNFKHYTLLNVTSSLNADVGCDICARKWMDQFDQKSCDEPMLSFPEPDPFPTFQRERKQSLVDHAIQVPEGGTVRLEPRHFYFLPTSTRIGLPNRNIIFHINQKPKHGKLTLLEHAVNTFTYQDVIDAKVNYTHDGLEYHQDSVEIELEIRGLGDGVFAAGFNVGTPNWQSQQSTDQRFVLPVKVAPMNDPPTLRFPSGKLLKIAQNTRWKITQDELDVIDQDTPATQVFINVTFLTPGVGFFEHSDRPGLPVNSFTYMDLLNKRISYHHQGGMNGKITLIASDPLDKSEPETMEIQAYSVEIKEYTNQPLQIYYNGKSTLTQSNLEFTSNARNQSEDIIYRILRPPKYGRLESGDEKDNWRPTRAFTQKQIRDLKIRYTKYENSEENGLPFIPSRDTFAFAVGVLNFNSTEEHELEIQFVRTSIKVFSTQFVLNNTLKLNLTKQHLFAHVNPGARDEDIVYQLVKPPNYGILYLVIDPNINRNRVLGAFSNFTQDDINKERVFYQVRYVQYTVVNDYFVFRTSALGTTTGEHRYPILYLPGEDDFKLINETVHCQEGLMAPITPSVLHLKTKDKQEFTFTIYFAPKNGELTIKSGPDYQPLKVNSTFTSEDIREHRLFYRHDDSESTEDSAYLIARSSSYGRGFAPQVPFWLSVKISLQNDHRPIRYNLDDGTPIFHIVKNGERLVTKRDLWYTDEDSDTQLHQIQYTFQYANDGGFYNAERPDIQMLEFTQDDVNRSAILFRHFGPKDHFALIYSVTDGRFNAADQFIVNASEPFLRVKGNTNVKVQRGNPVTLILRMETNLNVPTSGIVYKVTSYPNFGKLMLVDKMGRNEFADTFTQADMENFRVAYSHTNTNTSAKRDLIGARVRANDEETTVRIEINIIDTGAQSFQMIHFRELHVNRGGMATVKSEILKAHHTIFSPNQITYHVIKHPTWGTLVLDTENAWPNSTQSTTFWHGSADKFTQSQIDEGKLHYYQRTGDFESDEITMDVRTPNADFISGVVLRVIILDNEITITSARNLSVNRGKSASLRPVHLKVKRYDTPVDDHASSYMIEIMAQPKYGYLDTNGYEHDEEDEDEEENGDTVSGDPRPLRSFKYKDVDHKKIRYRHDGSRTFQDNFTVVAKSLDGSRMQSKPKIIHVEIKHKNEKAPTIKLNVPLEMHGRREATISSNHLKIDDPDARVEDIKIRVISPKSGYVAYIDNPSEPIHIFTQKDIDDGVVVFLHSGGSDGGFDFSVNDGKHGVAAQQFVVRATPVTPVKEQMVVSPGSTEIISPRYLEAKIGSIDPNRILYTVTKIPKHGVLLRDGVSKDSLTFTQEDVNQKLLVYKQNKLAKKWEVKDRFTFLISLNGTDIGERLVPVDANNTNFHIVITYGNMNQDESKAYVKITPVRVRENDKANLSMGHLNLSSLVQAVPRLMRGDKDFLFELTQGPDHGWLLKRYENLTVKDHFLWQDLMNGWIVYKHVQKSSTPRNDHMEFDIFPDGEARYPLHIRLDVEVLPSPVRKYMWHPKHLSKSLKLIQGQARQITTGDFFIDADQSIMQSIVYKVVKSSVNAYFAYTRFPSKSINEFSQEDINENRLDLVHNKSWSLESTNIFLIVSMKQDDGRPSLMLNHSVQIQVEKLTLVCPPFVELEYKQGAENVRASKSNLNASSNGPDTGILYNVTEPPKNGHLSMEQGPQRVTLFTQADVAGNRIYYTPTNMKSSDDSISMIVYNDFNICPRMVPWKIKVIPAVEQQKVTMRPNDTITIGEDSLKVDREIAHLEPQFIITHAPIHGLLVNEDDLRNGTWENVQRFTAKELKLKKIKYIHRHMVHFNQMQDGFKFELRARGVQPAVGRYSIWITPTGDVTLEPSGTIRPPASTFSSIPKGTDQGPSYPTIKPGYLVALAFVPLVLLSVMFLMIRLVRVEKERERRQLKDKLRAQQRQQQSQLQRSRPDLLDATLYSLGSTPATQVSELSASTSVIMRSSDPHYRSFTGERTASIKSGSSTKATGSLHRNGSGTMPARTLSLEKANKGMLTMSSTSAGLSPAPTTPTSHSGYHTFFAHDSPPPATRMVTFDPGRTEIISSVPMCKVTPLMPKPAPSTCSSSSGDDFRYAYQYSSSASEPEFKSDRLALDRGQSYRQHHQRKGPRSPIKQMKLKENQYWV